LWLFILYKIGEALSCYLPFSLSRWVAERIADFFFFFSFGKYKVYREAVLHNLSLILQDNTRTGCAREVFRNFANYLREFLLLKKLDKSEFFKRVILLGCENLDAALKKDKGVLLLSAHFGNWEWGGMALAWYGYRIYFLVRPHANPYTYRLFCNLREKARVRVIPVNYLKRALMALRDNSVVATLIDESDKGIEVNMFGKKLTLASGPFEIAYKSGALICPAFMIRDKETGKQKGIVETPIELNSQDKGSMKKAAQKFAEIMEDYLRFYPDHWFLFKKKIFSCGNGE